MNLKKHIRLAKLCKDIKSLKTVKEKNSFWEIKSILDDDYHSIIDDHQFEKYGHIYYGKSNQ